MQCAITRITESMRPTYVIKMLPSRARMLPDFRVSDSSVPRSSNFRGWAPTVMETRKRTVRLCIAIMLISHAPSGYGVPNDRSNWSDFSAVNIYILLKLKPFSSVFTKQRYMVRYSRARVALFVLFKQRASNDLAVGELAYSRVVSSARSATHFGLAPVCE